MSAFHNSQLFTMKANYMNKEGDIRIIRPLVYVRETETRKFAEGNKLHIYDISISFEKSMKSLQEMKNINFVKIDAHNRLYTIQDKAVRFLTVKH